MRLFLIVSAAVLTGVSAVDAQQVNWVELSALHAPPPRCCMGIGDTTWDGTTWTRQFRNSAPAARIDASMAYDATLGIVVLFGGYAGSWPDTRDDT